MKILIVDDSKTIRLQLRRDLEQNGFQVIEGTDGLDGLEQIRNDHEVRLVISDVNMPRMDGLTMSKKIREISEFKSLPIIIMTTESTGDMKLQAKEAGVMAWVTKPCPPEKLLAAISKILK